MTTHHPIFAEAWEWDESNESELARHHITAIEVEQLLEEEHGWRPNKQGRAGDYLLVGRTYGGRHLSIVVAYDERRRCARAVTGWAT